MSNVQRQPLRTGSLVSFRLRDATCPGLEQILGQLGPNVRVCGELAFFSDRGGDQGHFAIIAVDGLATPLIVPVAKLERSAAPRRDQAGETQDWAEGGPEGPDGFGPIQPEPRLRDGEQREAG